jgi:hypothetical protein
VGQVPDVVRGLRIDSRIDESQQEPILTNHSDRAIAGDDDFSGEIGDALEKSIDIEL